VRAEGRFAALDSRIAVLADSAARTEHRERDLNEKIAGVAEEMLRSGATAAAAAGSEVAALTSAGPRLQELEHQFREANSRGDRLEEAVRRNTKQVRRYEERFDEFEASARRSPQLGDLQEQIDELWQHRSSAKGDRGSKEHAARLDKLEEKVSAMTGSQDMTVQFAMICNQIEQQRVDLEVVAASLEERGHELQNEVDSAKKKADDASALSRDGSDSQQALSARIDDINLRVGSLKVKADSFEGRLTSISERVESTRRDSEEVLAIPKLIDRCQKVAEQSEHRIQVIERRMDMLSEDCEETVEQALEKRLAVLAGVPQKSKQTASKSQRPKGHGLGTPSKPSAYGDLRESPDDNSE